MLCTWKYVVRWMELGAITSCCSLFIPDNISHTIKIISPKVTPVSFQVRKSCAQSQTPARIQMRGWGNDKTLQPKDQRIDSTLRDTQIANVKSAHYLAHALGPWASPYKTQEQMTTMLHDNTSRQFYRTSNGENPPSSYRDLHLGPWVSPYRANG